MTEEIKQKLAEHIYDTYIKGTKTYNMLKEKNKLPISYKRKSAILNNILVQLDGYCEAYKLHGAFSHIGMVAADVHECINTTAYWIGRLCKIMDIDYAFTAYGNPHELEQCDVYQFEKNITDYYQNLRQKVS